MKSVQKHSNAVQTNRSPSFLNYIKLSLEDNNIWMIAKLNIHLDSAYKELFPEKRKNSNIIYEYSGRDLARIDKYIHYVLKLIGKYSNHRFGKTAIKQHCFFMRPSEQESFYHYLFMAIQLHKNKTITKKNPRVAGEIIIPYFGDNHLALKAYEGKKNFFETSKGQYATEKQLYAAAAFYMMNFVFDAVKKNDAPRVSALLANIHSFQAGPSYQRAYGKTGGKKTSQA